MITFFYRNTSGSQVLVALPLLEHDRFWPAQIKFSGQGLVQTVNPIRASDAIQIARGNRDVVCEFPATRQHASVLAAMQYVGSEIQKIAGVQGNLLIGMPGGGQVQMLACVCLAASGHYLGVRSYCEFQFRGPRPTP